jgi:NADH-quinone oxidoreductase subunit G
LAETPQNVTITIDGVATEVPTGRLLIAAAEDAGTYIPRFCWHPRMRSVGMCRMCLVEVETPRGKLLTTSCTTPVSDGMIVDTKSPVVEKAQEGVLEFLLINHPLDCPVCDKGGECPLQDQTLAYGPGESRYVEAKRHFEKPIPISELVLMDRERCILCDRCTRFSAEVSGDPLIAFMSRGNTTEVITFPDEPFASYFSGNTVQMCPVGALTAAPFRFKARPWDLEAVESVSLVDAVHSKISLQGSQNRLIRVYGVDSDATNHGWLSDKDRFIYEHVHSEARITTPLVRDGEGFRQASWSEAISLAADRIGSVLGAEVGGLGGARGLNEDAYAFSKFMRTAVVTPHIDAQLGDGLSADFAAAVTPRAAIADLDRAATILLWGPDLKETLPVLYLRVRRAVRELGATLIVVHPRSSGLDDAARHTVRYRPGSGPDLLRKLIAGDGHLAPVREALDAGPVVAMIGRTGLAEDPRLAESVAAFARDLPGATIMPLLRRGNVFGALDMGLAPTLLPGRVAVGSEAGRAALEEHWGVLPRGVGRDATGILEGLRDGELRSLVLFGADPIRDHPDPQLAMEAMAAAEFVLAFELFMSDSAAYADVVFPVAAMGECEGTATNLEGRVQKVNRLVPPVGSARPAWSILDDLASEMGADLGASSAEALAKEIAEVAPAYTGVTWDALEWDEGRDGVIVPTREGTQPLQHIPVVTTVPLVADRFGLHLGQILYDDGVMVRHAAALAAVRPEPYAHLHPRDASVLAVADGDRVIVHGRSSVQLPVRIDASLAEHTVYVPFNLGVTAAIGGVPSVSIDAVRSGR